MEIIPKTANIKQLSQQVLNAWNVQINSADKLINLLTDDQLQREVSANRNTGTYLVGHLTAVHDALHPLFGFGDKIFPLLENIFIKNPDKSGLEKPHLKELRVYWTEVNNSLSGHFIKFTAADWLQKHTAVTDEGFLKDPNRNKLAVLLNRTNHLAYHIGQLTFLKN